MALREPNSLVASTKLSFEHSHGGEMDYKSSQVRDLRDAVNEYIESAAQYTLEDTLCTNRMFNAILDRLDALESKMVDNTPKGGYNLKSEGTK